MTVKEALSALTEQIYEIQNRVGTWNPATPIAEEDMGSFFAGLHAKVSDVYASFNDEPENIILSWCDEKGKPLPEDQGYPRGLPAQLSELIMDILSFSRRIGVDLSDALPRVSNAFARIINEGGEPVVDVESVAQIPPAPGPNT